MHRALPWLLGLAALAGVVWADGRRITLAVPLSLQPYFIPMEGRGLAFDTIQAAFRTRDYTVQPFYISSRKNDRVLDEDPGVDCAALISPSAVGEWLATPEPNAFHDQAITLTASGLTLERVEDLKGKRVIAFRGARKVLGEGLDAVADDNPSYRELNNHRAQVMLLIRKRVDVIIADRLLVEWYVRHLDEESGVSHPLTYHELFPIVPYYFVCRRKDLLEAFLSGMEAIRGNGELARIRARYVGAPADPTGTTVLGQ